MNINRIPFRQMKPTLTTLRIMTLSALTAAYTKQWAHQNLAARIWVLKDKTDALKNPTRKEVLIHLIAWYKIAEELADAIQPTNEALATIVRSGLGRETWLAQLAGEVKAVAQ